MSERLFKTFHIGRGRGVWSRLTGVATNRVRNAVGKAVSFSSVTLTQFFPKRFSEWLFLKFVVFLLSCGRIRTETFKNDACVSRSRSWREVLKKKMFDFSAHWTFCISLKESNSSFRATAQGSLWKQTPFRLLRFTCTRAEKRASVILKFKNRSKLKDRTEVIHRKLWFKA